MKEKYTFCKNYTRVFINALKKTAMSTPKLFYIYLYIYKYIILYLKAFHDLTVGIIESFRFGHLVMPFAGSVNKIRLRLSTNPLYRRSLYLYDGCTWIV